MNWDSPGCFGGAADGITPSIDKLASEGMRFWHAYVNVSICTPSRCVLLTGLHSQNNRAEGFQRIHPGTATLPALLNEAGFLCGTVGKPLSQEETFRWSVAYRWPGAGDEDRWGRDPDMYRIFSKTFFEMAKVSKQPFFLMASSHDPHHPFARGKATRKHEERADASRSFRPEDVRLPGLLPDLPEMRAEFARYCTSVRRLDDMVGAILDELEKAKLADDTIVVFLSDHGMDFPGAKFNCYVDSMRSPWIVRWPGQVAKGAIDRKHMISSVDFQATILEAVGLPVHRPTDGRSFLPLLRGEEQEGRDYVFTQFHHIHGADALPMRSVLARDAAYVFNPWSNGKRTFRRLGHQGFHAMVKRAKADEAMAARVRYLRFRAVEELFDLESDPNCLRNLLAAKAELAPSHQKRLAELRAKLREHMVAVNDPALEAFDRRDDPAACEAFVQSYRKHAAKIKEELRPYEKRKGYRF